MTDRARTSHPVFNLLPTEIEGFDSLAEPALDMRWSWNHATDEAWRQLDFELWDTSTCVKLASFGLQPDGGVIHETR